MDNTSGFWRASTQNAYTVYDNDKYTLWTSGVPVSQDSSGNLLSPMEIGQGVYEKTIDFNQINGWFKLVIYAKDEQRWMFFGDNSGSQFFCFDRERGTFSDSLLAMRAMLGESAHPDMVAIVQWFKYGRIFGERTIVSGIFKTDPQFYYLYSNGKVEQYTKSLHLLSEMSETASLDDIMEPTILAVGKQKVCAVCTGGTDSRTVLACLIYHGINPDLIITGHKDNPDIRVAQKVADTLKLQLTVINPDEKETNWLEKAFFAFDGEYDVVLSYRHLQKRNWTVKHGYTVEFGGVGGEFYKNAFCHPFRYGVFSKPDLAYFQKNMFRFGYCPSWFGDDLKSANIDSEAQLSRLIKDSLKERTMLQKCNKLGLDQLSCVAGAITNGYGTVCCKIDPLMDRRLIADVSRCNPITLSMHMWQRKQVAIYCPDIAEIETDQGYTCSLNSVMLLKEKYKKLGHYLGLAVARVKRKLGLNKERRSAVKGGYWNSDYEEARHTGLWSDALAYCKKAGIIRADAGENQIPMDQTGWILLIGLIFDDGFIERYNKHQKGEF